MGTLKCPQRPIQKRSRLSSRNLVSILRSSHILAHNANARSVQHSSITQIGIQEKRSSSTQSFKLYNLHRKFYVTLYKGPNMTRIEAELGSTSHSPLQQDRISPSVVQITTSLHLRDGPPLPTRQIQTRCRNHQPRVQVDTLHIPVRSRHLGQELTMHNHPQVHSRLGNG